MEDVIGRLKAVQDREQATDSEPSAVGGKLLYTAEQWWAFEKEDGTGSSKDRRRRPRGGKKNKPKGDRDSGGQAANARKIATTPASTATRLATGPKIALSLGASVATRRMSRKQRRRPLCFSRTAS